MINFFNYSVRMLSQKLKLAILLISFVYTGSAYASPDKIEAGSDTIPDSVQTYRYLTLNSFGFNSLKFQKKRSSILNSGTADPFWVSDTIPSKTAILPDKLIISGIIRFITYYRDMSTAYSD